MSVTETHTDPCVFCNQPTSFGSGRFVNRISGTFCVDDKTVEGWACAECAGYECDECDKQIYLDEEVRVLSHLGYEMNYHPTCYDPKLHGTNVLWGD